MVTDVHRNKTELFVSISSLFKKITHVYVKGEPTLQEQAKILIETLDLGSSVPIPLIGITFPDYSPNIRIAGNSISVSASGKSLPIANLNPTNRSRRSIHAVCGSPSIEICPRGKQTIIVSNNQIMSTNKSS